MISDIKTKKSDNMTHFIWYRSLYLMTLNRTNISSVLLFLSFLFSFFPKRKYRPPCSGEFTTSKMSAAISSLASYGSDSDSEHESETIAGAEKEDQANQDATVHLRPLESGQTMSLAVLNSAPEVSVKVSKARKLTLA